MKAIIVGSGIARLELDSCSGSKRFSVPDCSNGRAKLIAAGGPDGTLWECGNAPEVLATCEATRRTRNSIFAKLCCLAVKMRTDGPDVILRVLAGSRCKLAVFNKGGAIMNGRPVKILAWARVSEYR